MSIIFSSNITLLGNKCTTEEALLFHHNWSSPSFSDSIFLHHILKMKPNYLYQTLDICDNNGRTLVGTAKRWPLLLNRSLIFPSFLQLFWNLDYWLLNRGWLAD